MRLRPLNGLIYSDSAKDLFCVGHSLLGNLGWILFVQGQVVAGTDVLMERIWDPQALQQDLLARDIG